MLVPGVVGGVISRDDLFVELIDGRGEAVVAGSDCTEMGGTPLVAEDVESIGVVAPELLSSALPFAAFSAFFSSFCLPLSFFASGWMARAFRAATGKSATPIATVVILSTIAPAPPLIGSVGPMSTSYSFGL